MSFLFYDNILQQSDLQEVAKDISYSLYKLESLYDRLNSLTQEEKNSLNFAENLIKVNHLINKEFPRLIEDYTNLDLEYRNTTIIKKQSDKEYTSKDILVENIGKLKEEITIIDQEFNNNYSRELLVQNRILNSMGVQKNLFAIEVENIKPVILKNSFDYNQFKQINPQVFIKNKISTSLVRKQEDTINKSSNIKKEKFFKNIFKNTALLLSIAAAVWIGSLSVKNVDENGKANYTTYLINYIIAGTQILYSNSSSYQGLNEQVLLNTRIVTSEDSDNKIYTGYNTHINISPNTIEKLNDSMKLTLNEIPRDSCSILTEKLSKTVFKLNSVKVNNQLIIKNGMIDLVNVDSACNLSKNQFIIEQK